MHLHNDSFDRLFSRKLEMTPTCTWKSRYIQIISLIIFRVGSRYGRLVQQRISFHSTIVVVITFNRLGFLKNSGHEKLLLQTTNQYSSTE